MLKCKRISLLAQLLQTTLKKFLTLHFFFFLSIPDQMASKKFLASFITWNQSLHFNLAILQFLRFQSQLDFDSNKDGCTSDIGPKKYIFLPIISYWISIVILNEKRKKYFCVLITNFNSGRIKALLLRRFFNWCGNWCGEVRPPNCGAAEDEPQSKTVHNFAQTVQYSARLLRRPLLLSLSFCMVNFFNFSINTSQPQ